MKDFNVKVASPKIKLITHTSEPFALAIASARTCYSSDLVTPDQVTSNQKERIGGAIYEAGHHTPFQHPTFVFSLEGVSRQFVWSFLHSHPYYNSEQTSQRYVALDRAEVIVPQMNEQAQKVFNEAVLKSWDAYNKISDLLKNDFFVLMNALGKIKNQTEKQIQVEAEKKAMENARYVVPIAASTTLYHTVSGIVLKRYERLMLSGDCPEESRIVIQQMLDEVKKIDPEFLEKLPSTPINKNDLLENKILSGGESTATSEQNNEEFDKRLNGKTAKLISHQKDAEQIICNSLNEVLGTNLKEEEAIDWLLSPKKNPYLADTLNSTHHSPAMRALQHINYTFIKKISHTADSQDQRHRTVPATRPLLSQVHTKNPDYYIPSVAAKNPEVKKIYEQTMQILWDAKNKLIELGVEPQKAVYILPNAVNIRYTQTGSLLNNFHKWRLRTCLNAQLEIFDASVDEINEVAKVHPNIAKYIGPPCFIRDGIVENKPMEGPCPEGSRWCGISVWKAWPNVKRPF
ncbi:FAD-dependent thymidylate synthase [Patescibacteria group bacterium]|nr:FAD-dependent thymidylate synthase [Patescibacteria group bacterium]